MQDRGPEELCANVWAACEKYSAQNVGYFALALCILGGYTVGESTVKGIRKWVRAKPGNVMYYAFYLFAVPISLGVGLQGASLAGVISPYMSMAVSFGILIGISHTLNTRADGSDGKQLSTKSSGPMVKVIAWSHFRRTIVWVDTMFPLGTLFLFSLASMPSLRRWPSTRRSQASSALI